MKAAGAGVAGLVTAQCTAFAANSAARKRKKPNLLFIWTDEQRADTMAVYGNTKIRVPNMNRLAGESVVFKNAYVTQPVCTPNRSAVMTGQWPHMTGLLTNNIPLPAKVPCLPEMVADQDYRTAYMGKWHLGDELFAQHGFDEWVSMEDGYGSGFSEGRDRNTRSDYHHFLVEHGYQPGSDGKFSRNFAAGRPIEHCKPKFLELKACDFLRRHRNEPFILYVNFLEPHMPFTGPLDAMYDPNEVDVPASFNDPLEDNEPEYCKKKLNQCLKKYGTTEQDYRKLIARYWGLNSQVDRSVGAILDTLEQLGLADDTIVVYTSDHGDMMGAHRLVEKGVMYQEATRIPWLMRVPAMGLKQRVIDHPVSQIDLVPTLLELMGHSQAAAHLPGKSLVPVISGQRTAQDDVFIEWNTEPRIRTVVSDGWKLCLTKEDKCQLFNLRDDPGETTNLFDSRRHAEVISRLTAKIHKWQKSAGDDLDV